MNTAAMRVELAKRYPTKSFKEKLSKMRDDQVVAMFMRITNKPSKKGN